MLLADARPGLLVGAAPDALLAPLDRPDAALGTDGAGGADCQGAQHLVGCGAGYAVREEHFGVHAGAGGSGVPGRPALVIDAGQQDRRPAHSSTHSAWGRGEGEPQGSYQNRQVRESAEQWTVTAPRNRTSSSGTRAVRAQQGEGEATSPSSILTGRQ